MKGTGYTGDGDGDGELSSWTGDGKVTLRLRDKGRRPLRELQY